MSADDYLRRDIGRASAQAVQAVELAAWKLSAETLERAEALYSGLKLTPDAAYGFLIALIEQRRILQTLASQVDGGVRAAKRIEQEIVAEAEQEAREKRIATQGQNRFVRSRVRPAVRVVENPT